MNAVVYPVNNRQTATQNCLPCLLALAGSQTIRTTLPSPLLWKSGDNPLRLRKEMMLKTTATTPSGNAEKLLRILTLDMPKAKANKPHASLYLHHCSHPIMSRCSEQQHDSTIQGGAQVQVQCNAVQVQDESCLDSAGQAGRGIAFPLLLDICLVVLSTLDYALLTSSAVQSVRVTLLQSGFSFVLCCAAACAPSPCVVVPVLSKLHYLSNIELLAN